MEFFHDFCNKGGGDSRLQSYTFCKSIYKDTVETVNCVAVRDPAKNLNILKVKNDIVL